MDEWMDAWTSGWVDGLEDESMNGWANDVIVCIYRRMLDVIR